MPTGLPSADVGAAWVPACAGMTNQERRCPYFALQTSAPYSCRKYRVTASASKLSSMNSGRSRACAKTAF